MTNIYEVYIQAFIKFNIIIKKDLAYIINMILRKLFHYDV